LQAAIEGSTPCHHALKKNLGLPKKDAGDRGGKTLCIACTSAPHGYTQHHAVSLLAPQHRFAQHIPIASMYIGKMTKGLQQAWMK